MLLSASRVIRNNQNYDSASKALLAVDMTLGALFLLGAGAVILTSMHVPFLAHLPHYQQLAGSITHLSPVGLTGAAATAAVVGGGMLLDGAVVAKLKHDGSQNEEVDLPGDGEDTALEEAQARLEAAGEARDEAIAAQKDAATDLAAAQTKMAALEDAARAQGETPTADAASAERIRDLEAKLAAAHKAKEAAEARVGELEKAAAAATETVVHAAHTAPATPPPPAAPAAPPPPPLVMGTAAVGPGRQAEQAGDVGDNAGRNDQPLDLLASIRGGKQLNDASKRKLAERPNPESDPMNLADTLRDALATKFGAAGGGSDTDDEGSDDEGW